MSGFDAIRAFPQWLTWERVERAERVDKIPTHPQTGAPCDAHDPANWTTHAAAVATGRPVAFVLTDRDPFFCVDIDHCHDGSQWSPLAVEVCQWFDGCAVEVSQSGAGLHIWGTYQHCPEHGVKGPGYDLFTRKRFIALSGNEPSGDSATDRTELINRMAAAMPPGADFADEWTDGPRDGWSGPESDEQLVQRALRSQSAAAVFGNKASFSDLWTGNDRVLSECYPSSDPMKPYDASRADAALCAHLAFWTGADCERMDRLFRASALYRSKWERDSYGRQTIVQAAGKCTDVYSAARSATPPPARNPDVVESAPNAVVHAATFRTGMQYLMPDQQVELFRGCVYVRDVHRVFTPDGAMLKPDQFKSYYGGYVFALDSIGDKTTRNAWDAFTESQAVNFPKVNGLAFRPEIPPGSIVIEEGSSLINSYVPIDTPHTEGDPAPFVEHLRKLFPVDADREIIVAYMAAIVQFPGVKFQWCPLIQGAEGNGKTLLINAVANAVGWRYTHTPNAAELGGGGQKFNSWLERKLFIGVEEIYVSDRREVSDALKPLITNSRIEIQGKGVDQHTGDNRGNFIMSTNHKDALIKNRNDRRYAVFFTAQQSADDIEAHGMGGDYFPNLYAWLRSGGYAIVTQWLRSYAIPDALNPAGALHRAPDTSSTNEVLELSRSFIEQEILEAIEQGLPGFAAPWVSTQAIDKLVESRRLRLPRPKRGELMERLGYVLHPNLASGRLNSVSVIDGGKPRLYVREGHPAAALEGAHDILVAYLRANGVEHAQDGPPPAAVKRIK